MTEIKSVREFEYDGKTYTIGKRDNDYLITDAEQNIVYGGTNADTVETMFRHRMTLKSKLKERLASLVSEGWDPDA